MEKLIKIFNKIGLKLRYINTKESLKVPYAIYKRLEDDYFFSDNELYLRFKKIRVEIYFDDIEKFILIEKKLEEELKKNKFYFLKGEDIILDENIIMVNYEIGGIIDNERSC